MFEHEGGRVVYMCVHKLRSSHQRCSTKKKFLKISQNLQENRPQGCNSIKRETSTQVFSCEFCKFFQNTYFTEWLWDNCFCILHKQLLFLWNEGGFTQLKLIQTIVEECKIFSTKHNNRFSSSCLIYEPAGI